MSFILDALKKSEAERQRQNTPGFAGVPDAIESPRAPRWLWVLIALLAVNLLVLIGVMLRPDIPPVTPAKQSIGAPAANEESTQDASFSEMVAEAKKKQPQTASDAPDNTVETTSQLAKPAPPARVSKSYSTFDELRAKGALDLPDLHLDIHVYSANPSERFVFVNMSKYKEHETLTEGPVVKEITPEGVILEQLGTDFLLPRE